MTSSKSIETTMERLCSQPVLGASSLVVFVALLALSRPVRTFANDILSAAINTYLCWRYPIKSEDGRSSLPTCPYRWPNGQGDVEKFLKGVENSAKWEKERGSVYRIWSGMNSEVVVTRPEHVQAVFRDSDRHSKATNNDAGWLMGELLGRCVGLISSADWKRVRAATEPAFLYARTRDYVPLVQDRAREHFAALRDRSHGAGLLHPTEDLKMLPFWVVADVLYGRLPARLEAELLDLAPGREALFRRVVAGGVTRHAWSAWLPTATNRSLRDFQARWSAFNDAAHAHALDSPDDDPPAVVGMYAALREGRLSRVELDQTLDEILFANLDVTVGGLSWNLLFLAADHDVQGALRAEVAAARTRAKEFPHEWRAYLQDGGSLLARVVLESARLKPLAAFSVPQAAPTARAVDGYVVPAGTSVVVDAYALNVRNGFWGGDAGRWRPGRWEGLRPTETRYHYWRFGFGPRTCMGRHLAELVIRTALAHLVKSYEVGLPGQEGDWDRSPETWITHPASDVLCRRLD